MNLTTLHKTHTFNNYYSIAQQFIVLRF